MKTKRGVGAGVGLLAVSLVGAGLALSAATSSAATSSGAASAKTHTQTFSSRDVKSINLDKKGDYVDFAKDAKNGKVIGADSSSGKYNANTGVVSADVSILRKGGLMYGTFTLDTHTLDLSGKITGGLGQYKGVKGTITGKAVNKNNSKVTITYHL